MRKGGGKSKGGSFEHLIAEQISTAMKVFGIHADDCYRTKNSGATKAQPGDLQFSPALCSLLPATIECKHYAHINYKLGKPLHLQPKSYPILDWWKQLKREEKDAGNKFGLLIMRGNHCSDLVAFAPKRMVVVFDALNMPRFTFSRYNFKSLIITRFHAEEVWIVPLSEFLEVYALHVKWFTLFDKTLEQLRIISRGASNANSIKNA